MANDERTILLGFLAQQRHGLRNAAFGLTEAQARRRSTVSELSIASLLRHSATTERSWISLVQGGPMAGDQGYTLTEADTLPALLDDYAAAAAETARAVATVGLDDAVPVPRGVPWFPDDLEAWSVRWVLLHLIQETARHAGNADIIRESIDGATSFALMAAVESWSPTPWLHPWTPPAEPDERAVTSAPPAGYQAVTPWIASRDSRVVLDFVHAAFGATSAAEPVLNEDGSVGHAEVRLGDATIMLFDTQPEWRETIALLRLYVDDAAMAVERAVAAGATLVTRPAELFFGDIVARVRDPQGHIWWLQQRCDVPAEQLAARARDPRFVEAMLYVRRTLSDGLSAGRRP
jgi:uncharacterized glyoxalase superfamily protein PhnB/uncharacterized damage-inducible protein DinB